MPNRLTGRFALLCIVTALAGTGAAAAATAPTASTGPVTSIAPTTATVAGSVNPNGAATTWFVEYGTTTAYGTKSSSASAGSGTSTAAVSTSLTPLKPGTIYHYRFVATSSLGTGRGADGILTTPAAPVAPIAVTGTATNISATAATLNGTVDPSGRATTWNFEYGTTTNYGTKTPAKSAGSGTSPAAVSAPVTGLVTGHTYHFRLVATSDAGTSRGSDRTLVAAAAPTVTTKPASSSRDTSATLNGTVQPNGQATTANYEYGTSTSYGTKTPAKNIGSGTGTVNVPALVTGLAGSTTYHFRLVATNVTGTTAGADQTFTTTGRPFTTTGAATGVTAASATLTGTVDPNGHSTSWYFEYGTTTGYGTKTATPSAGSSVGARPVSVAITGLTPGTTYHFRLVATSSAGTSPGADATFATVGPTVTSSASPTRVIYGHPVTLRGSVSSKQPNAMVAVFAAGPGAAAFTAVATVLTDATGAWNLIVKPGIRTTYKAVFDGGSAFTTVFVRPAVSLAARANGRFAARVVAGRSFSGRIVQLQRRRPDGSWLTIARARAGARSTAVFHPRLPHGRSFLRAAISAGQAGPGYLAGFSASLSYRRR
jgi:hypothetical protein